jgi:ATP-dependent HslUV protease ATP-binding subunit HslU
MEAVRPEAERRAASKIADLLEEELPRKRKRRAPSEVVDNPIARQAMEMLGLRIEEEKYEAYDEDDDDRARAARRRRLIKEVNAGKLDSREIEIEIEEPQNPFVQVFTPQGMEEMGLDTNQVGSPFPPRRMSRRTTVADARQVLFEEEAKRLIDRSNVFREAVLRAEQTGIIFLDELDKVAGKSGGAGPDVSREGVQRDLLPIIEGSTVATKFGPLKTDHILFIAAGAFHISKPSDLIPELQGRLPIRVELESLSEADFRRILHEPRNALTIQYVRLLSTEGVKISFTPDSLDEIAHLATEVNSRTENIGARRLHTMMEKLLEEVLFEAPEIERKEIVFDGPLVRERLSSLVEDVDLSKYIL